MCPHLKGEICFYDKDAETEIREMDEGAIRLLRLKAREGVKWADIGKKIPGILHEWAKEYCNDCDWRNACERMTKYSRLIEGFSGEKTES